MRISDWSSDVCSSDLRSAGSGALARDGPAGQSHRLWNVARPPAAGGPRDHRGGRRTPRPLAAALTGARDRAKQEAHRPAIGRSEEHTSELQSLMRISYAVFCLKKNK